VHDDAVLPDTDWYVFTPHARQAPDERYQPAGHCGATHVTVTAVMHLLPHVVVNARLVLYVFTTPFVLPGYGSMFHPVGGEK
jgi:hypothetical protein